MINELFTEPAVAVLHPAIESPHPTLKKKRFKKCLKEYLGGWELVKITQFPDYASVIITNGTLLIQWPIADYTTEGIQDCLFNIREKIDNVDLNELNIIELIRRQEYAHVPPLRSDLKPKLIKEMYHAYGTVHNWDANFNDTELQWYITCKKCKAKALVIDTHGHVTSDDLLTLTSTCNNDENE